MCTRTLFSGFYYPPRVRCPGPRVSMGNGREQTRASGKVQFEVQLFGGTVCSGETVFLQ